LRIHSFPCLDVPCLQNIHNQIVRLYAIGSA
jgi:hypothetical protein